MDKAKFYWAIIGDANPEPVAVCTEQQRDEAEKYPTPDLQRLGQEFDKA